MNEIRISGISESMGKSIKAFGDRWGEIQGALHFVNLAAAKAREYDEITVGGHPVPISDENRSALLEFIAKAKINLQRQAGEMALTVKIGAEDEDEEDEEEEEEYDEYEISL